ncbi:Ppx-GppA-domain-containing protein [Eremomyces bilateralis CBS 781.70]|uniref:Ppx-GppA-domain-containing protein n=1 Tax=Eremomyces bilateralis CBS 781.70 TaxID=1392243 RepID=A0A6G1G456_9PEZI|nr:Ppx-GppA-domain-containing protein [Eremomyces bilateralis CBS 781.70]KAF1812843.1 Ppx-GppA-domain-containing protein [Eremomyces bilateralis CBS 781.70]
MEPQAGCENEAEYTAALSNQRVSSIERQNNGIRFSISDLAPPTARVLPTVYSSREDIGLYDAQFDPDTGERIPIPEFVICAVVVTILRFQVVCADHGVPNTRIRILATEATRTAVNSEEFRKSIYNATGLSTEMLPKEEEGLVGAWGIASGFSEVEGILLDLGGGSIQISWMIFRGGEIEMSPRGPLSFPYGAAALTRTLKVLEDGKTKAEAARAVAEFRREVKASFLQAYGELQIPFSMYDNARMEGGFPLYLSGGGFRGWGYLILSRNQQGGHHYPISIINGYTAGKDEFRDTEALKHTAKSAQKIFRVSDRRRAQVPAVAFLIDVLAESIPNGIRNVHFCQGGVREGVLFQTLNNEVRKQDPLEVATTVFARPSTEALFYLLKTFIPASTQDSQLIFPTSINDHQIRAFINALYVHAPMGKESASTSALYSTSTGILSAAHGISHKDRALLALMLEERYEGDLPPREVEFKESLRRLLTREEIWWTRYLGAVGELIAAIYPAGVIDMAKPRIIASSRWSNSMGKNRNELGINLTITVPKDQDRRMRLKDTVQQYTNDIMRVGRKKHWIGEEPKWGIKVDVGVID